jgi:hypothetical protein
MLRSKSVSIHDIGAYAKKGSSISCDEILSNVQSRLLRRLNS